MSSDSDCKVTFPAAGFITAEKGAIVHGNQSENTYTYGRSIV